MIVSPKKTTLNENQQKLKDYLVDKSPRSNLNCCAFSKNVYKRKSSNELINIPQKEVDFKKFFEDFLAKDKRNSHEKTEREPRHFSNSTNFNKNNNNLHNYKYNIFKNTEFMNKRLNDNINALEFSIENSKNYSNDMQRKSFSPIRKTERSASKNSIAISQEEKSSPIFLRLSEKYRGDLKKSSDNISDLSLGEFLCINCDEFIDIQDMNSHFADCEKTPENVDLILINYKLEKIKNVLLLDMKNDTSLLNDKALEETLNIFLNCIQKTIVSNNKTNFLNEISLDLNEIRQLLNTYITKFNKVYLTLIGRVIELVNLKLQISKKEDESTIISSYIKESSVEKKIFAPPRTHMAYVEQKEQGWDQLSNENIANKNKKRIIFGNLDNFKKNEELLLAKPREISLSPSRFSQAHQVTDSKEPEYLKKVKDFLQEKEKKRIKFMEKINKIENPYAFTNSQTNNGITYSDANRRKRFNELIEKLKKNSFSENYNIGSNTELYEECQTYQIHEKNWEGYMDQKLKNCY